MTDSISLLVDVGVVMERKTRLKVSRQFVCISYCFYTACKHKCNYEGEKIYESKVEATFRAGWCAEEWKEWLGRNMTSSPQYSLADLPQFSVCGESVRKHYVQEIHNDSYWSVKNDFQDSWLLENTLQKSWNELIWISIWKRDLVLLTITNSYSADIKIQFHISLRVDTKKE